MPNPTSISNPPDLPPLMVLAGGRATRLFPKTKNKPKILLSIAGQPFIDHLLELYAEQGLKKIILCVGNFSEQIQAYIKDGTRYGIEVLYSDDGPTLRGTGGAIQEAAKNVDGPFFVTYGDSYLNTNYREIWNHFRNHEAPALMTVFRNEDHWDLSNVEFADDEIIAYSKSNRTERMKHIDYGLSILTPEALKDFQYKRNFDLSEVFQTLLKQKILLGFEVRQRFYEAGSEAGIRALERFFQNSKGNHHE